MLSYYVFVPEHDPIKVWVCVVWVTHLKKYWEQRMEKDVPCCNRSGLRGERIEKWII
jgi:hypothetical protein